MTVSRMRLESAMPYTIGVQYVARESMCLGESSFYCSLHVLKLCIEP